MIKNNKILLEEALLAEGIKLDESLEMSSLQLVTVAVAIEKLFKVRFSLDEISLEKFQSIDSILHLVENKIKVI